MPAIVEFVGGGGGGGGSGGGGDTGDVFIGLYAWACWIISGIALFGELNVFVYVLVVAFSPLWVPLGLVIGALIAMFG